MYLIKLTGSKAELRQTNGNLVRYIGNNDVLFGDLNSAQDHVLITTTSGKVELRALNNLPGQELKKANQLKKR